MRVLLDAPGVVALGSAVDAGVVGGYGRGRFGRFLHQLEDGQPDGDDEREERQLQGVPGLQAQHSDGERDQGEGFEHDEHHDRHEDLLQLMTFACETTGGLRSNERTNERTIPGEDVRNETQRRRAVGAKPIEIVVVGRGFTHFWVRRSWAV